MLDSNFSTTWDNIFADFKAHDLIIDYLTEEINDLENISKKNGESIFRKFDR